MTAPACVIEPGYFDVCGNPIALFTWDSTKITFDETTVTWDST